MVGSDRRSMRAKDGSHAMNLLSDADESKQGLQHDVQIDPRGVRGLNGYV